MMQHLALLCSWNSAMHFIPFQGFLRCSHGLQLLLLGHDMFCSDLAINEFTVLLSHQQADPRDVLLFSILIIVVVLIAAGPDKLE